MRSRLSTWMCRGIAVMCLLTVLVSCVGCSSSNTSSSSEKKSDADASQTQNDAKIASSLTDYVQTLIDSGGDKMSDQQKRALERAKETGRVSRSDYERAWSDWKQCIVDKGYTAPELTQLSNGIYTWPTYTFNGASKEAQRKFNEDSNACGTLHIMDINTVYKLQIGNPNLLQNGYEAAVDCLHKESVKPNNYTAAQLKDDWEAGKITDLRNDEKAVSCLVAAGINVSSPQEKVWYPLG